MFGSNIDTIRLRGSLLLGFIGWGAGGGGGGRRGGLLNATFSLRRLRLFD